MRQRAACVSAFFALASFAATGCNGTGASDIGVSGLTGPSGFALASIAADPTTITPVFGSGPACRGHAPFEARLNVGVRARHDVFIRGVGFEFVDRLGRRVRPRAFPVNTIGAQNSILPAIPLPTSPPIPLPTSPAIPIPGGPSMSDAFVPAHAFLKLPFGLHFDCGVPTGGTLFVSVTTADRRGSLDVSRITAHISE
jgi:hypothetical protein